MAGSEATEDTNLNGFLLPFAAVRSCKRQRVAYPSSVHRVVVIETSEKHEFSPKTVTAQ